MTQNHQLPLVLNSSQCLIYIVFKVDETERAYVSCYFTS